MKPRFGMCNRERILKHEHIDPTDPLYNNLGRSIKAAFCFGSTDLNEW